MRRRIRMGMVGGGQGAFIGEVHRMAAALDGHIELVAGAFSSDAERSKSSGADLYLNPDRVYGSYRQMIEEEAALPANKRIDLVSIVTPNHVHFEPAKLALEAGFHVVCDKPLCFDLNEAYALQKTVKETGLIFGLTHTYAAYPMVKQAKAMIAEGKLGVIKKIVVQYPQGWLSTMLESTDQKQASWRTDPSKSGIAGALGDIGTHAYHLAEYVTGLQTTSLSANVNTMVAGRKLDDDNNILLKFNNGAHGVLVASQISAGEANNLNIGVYGALGGLLWSHENPNQLIVKWSDKASQTYQTGGSGIYPIAQHATRLPSGHPEGYIEAFANIYTNVAHCIQAKLSGKTPTNHQLDFPTIDDGVRGMEFIYKAVQSGKANQDWVIL